MDDAQEQVQSRATDCQEAEKHPATPVGGKGKQFCVPDGTNQEALINGRIYCGHALDQMQERGIYSTMVEAAIENGVKEAQQIKE